MRTFKRQVLNTAFQYVLKETYGSGVYLDCSTMTLVSPLSLGASPLGGREVEYGSLAVVVGDIMDSCVGRGKVAGFIVALALRRIAAEASVTWSRAA
jgi:hypothetical protein